MTYLFLFFFVEIPTIVSWSLLWAWLGQQARRLVGGHRDVSDNVEKRLDNEEFALSPATTGSRVLTR